MKAAFTEWNGRIAPLFDVAQTVRVVEAGMSDKSEEKVLGLPLGSPEAKVTFLVEHAVDVLVCGAISREVRERAEAEGIEVCSFTAGRIRPVVNAWMHGNLDQAHFSMPGCRKKRWQLRQYSGRKNK